jgi:hypothetical protein
MSREWKIAIGVIGVALCLCGVSCVSMYIIGQRAMTDTFLARPEQAAKIGREIADYALPSGYAELFGVRLFESKWVIIGKKDDTDAFVIMLMQFPSDSAQGQEELQRTMEATLERQSGRRRDNYEVVGTQEAVIKGRKVTLTVRENTTKIVRQVIGIFPGKGNTFVMMMVMGKIKTWNQGVLDAFLASIR